MKEIIIFLTLLVCSAVVVAQHEDIPYQPVTDICNTCECLSSQDSNNRVHHTLNCAMKNFEHILARWPSEFGTQHLGIEIVASYSGNNIRLLQQLPATNATLTLSCRHCGMQQLQAPLFMDVPNIERLYLSWNELGSDSLKPDMFRGPFKATKYEPIGLKDLDLSHNRIATLDKKLFEHTPLLIKLNLAHNQLSVLDSPTTMALATCSNLQKLDLSHNAIVTLPSDLFGSLSNLHTLDVSGNSITVVPEGIQKLGKSLLQLNLASNAFTRLTETSFKELSSLRRLNISDMSLLRTMVNKTLSPLVALEQLQCTRNAKLESFDMDGLLSSRNLTQVDISGNALTSLWVRNSSANPWPRLRSLSIWGNPWDCSCELFQALEYANSLHTQQAERFEARCDTPYLLAGEHLSNLTAATVCNMVIPKKYRAVADDPPRFLRRRYIILTAIIASIVIVLGFVIGFIVVCVRRRLKGDDFGVQPIRYTSVRGSNMSAISQQHQQQQPTTAVLSKFNARPSMPPTGAPNA